MDDLEAWGLAALSGMGVKARRVDTLRDSAWSRVHRLRAETGEDFYVKRPNGNSQGEADVQEWFKGKGLKVTDIVARRGADFITKGVGAGTLWERARESGWDAVYGDLTEALTEYSTLQAARAVSGFSSSLHGGAPEIPTGTIMDSLTEWLHSERGREVVGTGDPLRGVGREEWDRLKAMEAKLKGAGVPDSFEHGDFQANNILEGAIFIDWGETRTAHPFMSWHCMAGSCEARGMSASMSRELSQVYEKPWLDSFGGECVRSAMESSASLSGWFSLLLLSRLFEDSTWTDRHRERLLRALNIV